MQQATTKVETKLRLAKQELNKAMTVYKQHPSGSHWIDLIQAMTEYQEVYFHGNEE